MAYVRIVFMKVNEVDTVKEVYTAKAFIQVGPVSNLLSFIGSEDFFF